LSLPNNDLQKTALADFAAMTRNSHVDRIRPAIGWHVHAIIDLQRTLYQQMRDSQRFAAP
jgi:hypothetical protein